MLSRSVAGTLKNSLVLGLPGSTNGAKESMEAVFQQYFIFLEFLRSKTRLMKEIKNILTDTHQRKHSYLRISLTERCNLRCTYCMPSEGVHLSPKSCLMTADEVYEIAKVFVKNGVTKIRLTGGEPLIRKDIHQILEKLASLPINLAITTNAVVVDRFIPVLKEWELETLMLV
ncbi:radical SAM protein [Aquimarina hainanensis]|uniref:radical SAM protein n=1 Tax=Aquimarina hainanensis TaxID=1578017 RepID=UPI00361019F2